MNKQLYDKILEILNKNPTQTRHELLDYTNKNADLANIKYNLNSTKPNEPIVTYETFTSIYGNHKRRQINRTGNHNGLTYKKLKDNSFNLCLKYKEYEIEQKRTNPAQRNIILTMANELGVSPVLLCRIILDGLIKMNSLEVNTELINSITPSTPQSAHKINITTLVKDTHLLKNSRLAAEILECVALDDDNGPSIDLIRNLIGYEYEAKLKRILDKHGLVYFEEIEMREKGYDKTPDFKLELPIYLSNGMCINWIDSKATFGDEQTHAENYESQFKFYLNRFGSGLVIYWFGYLADIEKLNFALTNNSSSSSKSASITISHCFPSEFTVLNVNSLLEN
jgi:hypothetical protein